MGINVENILRTADAIEQGSVRGLGFNMMYWMSDTGVAPDQRPDHACGTTACIAGWAVTVMKRRAEAPRDIDGFAIKIYRRDGGFMAAAADWFGLEGKDAYNLFYAQGSGLLRSQVTSAQAVAVLRHLAATGEVDWTISSPEAA